jgi:hypothetical protein
VNGLRLIERDHIECATDVRPIGDAYTQAQASDRFGLSAGTDVHPLPSVRQRSKSIRGLRASRTRGALRRLNV